MSVPCARIGLAAALAIAVTRGSAAAQAAHPLVGHASRVDATAVSWSASGAARPVWYETPTPVATRRRLGTPASIVGGALLGAWLGYFMSQVVKSDWEGMGPSSRLGHRRRFAFTGAAVGAVGGYILRPSRQPAGTREAPLTYIYVPATDRHFIARAELRRAMALNALEAVETLRPEWLQVAGEGATATFGRALSGATAGDSLLAVYVVNTRIGGPEALRDLAIPEVEELRLYEPEEAERRWGTPHPRGAIEVVPVAVRR